MSMYPFIRTNMEVIHLYYQTIVNILHQSGSAYLVMVDLGKYWKFTWKDFIVVCNAF